MNGLVIRPDVARECRRQGRSSANKKPRGRSGGANFSFFLSKEVTAKSVTGYRYFIVMDLDLLVFIIIVLLASKSCVCSSCATASSYTSLGQSNKSKTCANSS
jgi:hypothetical protein